MGATIREILVRQVTEAQARHPNIRLLRYPAGEWRVEGSIGFSTGQGEDMIEDSYNLDIVFPADYPASPPVVYEQDGKVGDAFGHVNPEGDLCLGAPVEVRRRFAEHKDLLRFIDEQVIPYLFACSYKRRFGRVPFGELQHGTVGLLEYYMSFFDTPAIEAMRLLKCLADDFAPPLMKCPCGQGGKLQECHGPKLAAIQPHQSRRQFEDELRSMIRNFRAAGVRLPERKVMPKRLWRLQERARRKKRRRRR